MDNNNLSGYLPPELANLPQLRIVYVPHLFKLLKLLTPSRNHDHILKWMSHVGVINCYLSYVHLNCLCSQLDNNNFDGTEIPAAYGNLSRLAKL